MTDYSQFTIVLPTLNEEGSVGTLIKRLLASCKGISIIVADDGSKDKTKRIVTEIGKKNRKVMFMDRKAKGLARGLTASAVDGILSSKTQFAIVMDADLQHPPEVAKKVAAALESGNDLTVAIRADVKGWELHRKLISKAMITFGYAVLVIRNSERCGDIFSGFFGVDRKLFAETYKKSPGRFIGAGYKVLYDFLKCKRHGTMRIAEVPYSFGLRQFGASKAGFKQGMLLFKSFFC